MGYFGKDMTFNNLLIRLVTFGLFVVVLTPLLISSDFLFPFLSPKVIVFQILVEIVFVLWLWLAFLDSSFRPKSCLILWGFIAYLLVSLVSAVLGVDFARSLWGISERLTGLVLEFHFFALFLVLTGFFRNNFNSWIKFLNFSFWVSVGVALSAFYQYLLPYLNISNSIFTRLTAERVSGVFGSPGFLAPYLLFHIFWGFWIGVKNLRDGKKLLAFGFLAGSLFSIFIVLLGATRGAVLGLAAAIFFLFFLLILGDFSLKVRKSAIASLLVLVLILGSLWLGSNSKIVQSLPFLARFTQFSSATPRIIAWQITLKGFQERLLFGTGPENFNYLFNKYYEPKLLRFGLGETWFDKPHNAYLEILSEGGIFGLAVFILLLVFLGRVLWKLYKSENNAFKFLGVLVSAVFLSYLVSNFFLFDSFGSWLGFFIWAAFLANFDKDVLKLAFNSSSFYFWGALVFSILILVGLWLNYSILRANVLDARALKTFGRNQTEAVSLFKKALGFSSPYQSAYQLDFMASIFGALKNNIAISDLEDNLNLALDLGDQVAAQHPNDAAVYINLLNFYSILGEKSKNKEILKPARDYGLKALELSPRRQEALFQWARVELLLDNPAKAIELSKTALELDEGVAKSHWLYGLALLAGGDISEAKLEVKKALDLGYQPQSQGEKSFILRILE